MVHQVFPSPSQCKIIENENGEKTECVRDIYYYQSIRKKPIESGVKLNEKSGLLEFKGRNVSGFLTEFHVKKTKKKSKLYFQITLRDLKCELKMNLFNVFEDDIKIFEELLKTNGIISLINFGMNYDAKQKKKKVFNIHKGYYILNAENKILEENKHILNEISKKTAPNTCLDFKEAYNHKQDENIEFFAIAAEIAEVSFGRYTKNNPFKFLISDIKKYGEYVGDDTVQYCGDQYSISECDVKYNISVTLKDEYAYVKDVVVNNKSINKLWSWLSDDPKVGFELWRKDASVFETKLFDEVKNDHYLCKTSVSECRNYHYKRLYDVSV